MLDIIIHFLNSLNISKGRLPDLPVNNRLGLKPIFQVDYFCRKFYSTGHIYHNAEREKENTCTAYVLHAPDHFTWV